ncbi:RING-H2 finger protein ATL14-like [Phoenix dactylifera]|uniref:RING-H2 finger protein ATL14-like n=1 Tax=Phoenix dactylifera TaxID=42345 RepID=A0A8B7CTQ0_PHODC|nr:RING-H2 finger protein ATL14-like [Phoenix dactylifera]
MTTRLLGIATQVMLIAIIISIALFFIAISVLVVLHVRIVGRAFQRWFLTISREERGGASNGLSPDELEKLPCYDFDAAGEKEGGGSVDCAVCLESFQVGERCRLLPLCKHSFHAQCVDSWLLTTPICPICRTMAGRRKGGNGFKDQQDRFASGVVMGFPVSANPPRF